MRANTVIKRAGAAEVLARVHAENRGPLNDVHTDVLLPNRCK